MHQANLLDKAQNLSKVRDQARQEANARAERIMAKKREEEEQRERIREQCIIEASEKIALKKKQKREEEARLRRELKEISIKRQFLQANAEMVEAKAHGEQRIREQRIIDASEKIAEKKRDKKDEEARLRRELKE